MPSTETVDLRRKVEHALALMERGHVVCFYYDAEVRAARRAVEGSRAASHEHGLPLIGVYQLRDGDSRDEVGRMIMDDLLYVGARK